MSGISSFFLFQRLFKKDIEAVSELTSENIFANINNLMDRPINVSIAMAHDTFLRDFMIEEEADGLRSDSLQRMKDYLTSYQQKYQFDSVFLVSVKSGAYYHYQNGLDRMMTTDNPENEWYFDFLKSTSDCSLNVDNDETKNDVITIFVNCKLYDENENLLGIVGVGLETPYIQQYLIENEQGYGIQAFLIDAQGNIQISSGLTEFEQVNLFQEKAYQDMAEAIKLNTSTPNQRWYHSSGMDGYVITKYVPNLNWYLVVEKNTQDFKEKMSSQLGLSMVFLLLVVVVVIKITTDIIKKYNLRLTHLAEVDLLTGIRNRTSYERTISHCAMQLDKYQSFGIGVFDLNNLKAINDQCGHPVGDETLKIFSQLLCDTFDHCPVFRIGGDEFVAIFENLSEEVVLDGWNQMLQRMDVLGRGRSYSISAAFGYSFWESEKCNTVDKIFKDADDKMYLNKAYIKKKVEP